MRKLRSRALSISYGNETIPVQVRFIDTGRFTVTVGPDLTVRANVPTSAKVSEVAARLEDRAGWIAQKRSYFKQFHPERAAQRFVSGASLWYLGKQYRLKTFEGRGRANLKVPYLEVPAADRAACERKVRKWYREAARVQFNERFDACYTATKPVLRMRRPPLLIRRMVKRWGSCTADGTVILNTELVRAPVDCIDYVIVHELCHVRVHSHSKAFYRLLLACMPDWERRKARLETFVA